MVYFHVSVALENNNNGFIVNNNNQNGFIIIFYFFSDCYQWTFWLNVVLILSIYHIYVLKSSGDCDSIILFNFLETVSIYIF